MIDLRLLAAPELRARVECDHCRRCGKATHDHKAFCAEHVLEQPYAALVRARLEAREHEQRLLHMPAGSVLVEDLQAVLREYGPSTVARLGVVLDVTLEVAERVASAAVRRGLAHWTGARRRVLELRPGRA